MASVSRSKEEQRLCHALVLMMTRCYETMVADSWFDQRTDAWLYQRVVEQMPLAVVVWQAESDDPQSLRLVYVNPHNVNVVGADLSAFVGLRFAEAFPAAVHTSLPDHIFAVATESEPEYHETYRPATSGATEIALRIDVRPLGRRCALVAYSNITQQQAAAAGQ